jgi:Ca2+-binding RTX toxin-like protein
MAIVGTDENDTFFARFRSGFPQPDNAAYVPVDGRGGTDRIIVQTNGVRIDANILTNVEVIDASGVNDFEIHGTKSYDLSSYQLLNVFMLRLGGLNETLVGSGGDDRIMVSRNSSFFGGGGDDTFFYRFGQSPALVAGGSGQDRIVAESNGAMIDWTKVSGIEIVDAAGKSNLTIVGTNGSDTLDFSGVTLAGVKHIDAGGGNDVIVGSAGSDRIFLGDGNDTISGGGGSDVFVLDYASSFDGVETDHIADFASGDNIEMGRIAYSSIAFLVANAFDGSKNAVRYDIGAAGTTVYFDLNGDKIADDILVFDNGYVPLAGDFVL